MFETLSFLQKELEIKPIPIRKKPKKPPKKEAIIAINPKKNKNITWSMDLLDSNPTNCDTNPAVISDKYHIKAPINGKKTSPEK